MIVEPAAVPVTGLDLHASIRYVWELGEKVYAVADAARDRELVLFARHELRRPVRWLFEDSAAAHMSEVAPWLIPVEFRSTYPYSGSEYLDLWAKHLGRSAGILLITEVEAEPLQTHLRQLFQVTDEEEHRYFFRFYDPRVLRVYLPTCTAAETQEFFGPVRQFLVESERSGRMFSYRPGRSGVEVKEQALGSSAESGSPGRDRR